MAPAEQLCSETAAREARAACKKNLTLLRHHRLRV
jgi:hypothetical protein